MDCNSQNLLIFLAHQLECKSVWSVLEINSSHWTTLNLSFAFPILTCKLNFLGKNQNRQVAVSIFLVIARILNDLFHWDVDVSRFCVGWQIVFTNSNRRPEGTIQTFRVRSIRMFKNPLTSHFECNAQLKCVIKNNLMLHLMTHLRAL